MTFKSIASVLPKIYCYSTPGVTYHEGWVKIGYTEQDDVVKRLEQQTKTAGINFKMEWTDYAIYKQDPDHQTFTDDDFKAFLEEKGIRHENNFGGDGRSIGDEWYEISPEKAQEYFNEFVQKPSMIKKLGYHLRTEQKDAVTATTDAMQSGKDTEYLWNAKPRFGKCLSAYDFIKQIHAEKVLIVTNRPAVVTSWYDDYAKFLGRESGYFFVSHVPSVKDKDLVIDYPEYEKDAARRKEEGYPPVKMIYFASLQDIKQSRFFGGDYIKLKELTTIEFDVLIIDESHEGVDTYRTDGALNRIRRKFTLYLSGTPFKAIQDEKFDAESIYNWTYVSEQEAKENWDGNGTNPYFQMPRLNMMTYRLSGIIGEEKPDLNDEEESTAEDRLNEFFKTNTSGFVHDAEVDKFLDTISGDEKYPFGSETQRGQLAHTFWLLSRVESAKALEEKLKKHPVFSRYAIVNVAGNNNDHAYEDVITAIAENPMTITLSVGRLTTGVTIPQWSAVMMLSERNSPAEYMQASFRAQNPYIFCRENKMTGRFEHFRKTDAYVFDFNPEHTLDIVEKFANNLYSSTANGRGDVDERRHNITQLLQYMPVTGEADDGRMEPLDADKVMLIPRKMRSQEVVRRGFMCDMLFQNVTNVFHITGNDIISKLPVFNGNVAKSSALSVSQEELDEMHLDENGEVHISDEEVAAEVERKVTQEERRKAGDAAVSAIREIKANPEATGKERRTEREQFAEAYVKAVQEAAVAKAKEMHPDIVTKQVEAAIKKTAKKEAEGNAYSIYSKYSSNTAEREADIDATLDADASEEDRKAAEELKKEVREEESQKLTEAITESVRAFAENRSYEIAEKEVEETKARSKRDEKLDIVKKHLKGFTRTIPSFLMAYGDDTFTLENLEEKIPEDVFEDVTSITLGDFKVLRDDCHYFDSTVFNDSVREFLGKRDALADYFDESAEEDIFDYIPPQKTNQIFTPKTVVSQMADYLAVENPGCFDDPANTFVDPYMKSGMYITEIVKRLFKSPQMKAEYPDKTERLKHIFAEQVYGLAPTEIIYRIAMSYIFGFADNKDLDVSRNHFKQFDSLPSAQSGTLEEDLQRLFGD